MLRTLAAAAALLLLMAPARGVAQATDGDALKLLLEVAQKYAKAATFQIEAVTETRQTDELSTSWRRTFTNAAQGPGNRYRYGGRNSSGSGLVVSDGTTEWEFHEAYSEFVKRPPGTYGHPFPVAADPTAGPEERNAFELRRTLGLLGNALKAAHWRPEESVAIGDRKISCLVVSFGPADFPAYDHSVNTFDERVWIDKERKVIVKTEVTSENRAVGTTAHGVVRHGVTTVVFPVASLDGPIPDQVFTFTPPADAKLVDRFTDPYAQFRAPAPAAPPDTTATPKPK
jgi:outer membrane lipoprotein-sorting protein